MKMYRFAALALALMMGLLTGLPALAEGNQIWKRGDSGEKVREIQARLQELGYLTENPTGTFDEATEKALASFQQEKI